MPNLDPNTLEWIVAIVKSYYTLLAELQTQKDTIDEEIASLTRRIAEDRPELNNENAYTKEQIRMIVTQKDLINSLRGDLADYEEAEASQAGIICRPSRVSGNSLSNVGPPSLPLPTACSRDGVQDMASQSAQEYVDRNQVDSEQRGVHDCDSCFLCIEEAKRDSPA